MIELDNVMMRCIQENENFMPDRWKKFIALFYPDAHIRKKYLKYLNIYMEDGTYSNLGICTDATKDSPVYIGKNVSIAPAVCFITESEPNNSRLLSRLPYIKDRLIKAQPIYVDDEVWIGAGAIILPGVRIGKCSVIGAGAVVTDDVEEYSIYAGVPAKKIRKIERER